MVEDAAVERDCSRVPADVVDVELQPKAPCTPMLVVHWASLTHAPGASLFSSSSHPLLTYMYIDPCPLPHSPSPELPERGSGRVHRGPDRQDHG